LGTKCSSDARVSWFRVYPKLDVDRGLLSDKQIRLLERRSPDFRWRHVESRAPSELLNQDSFYWRTLQGTGKVCVPLVVNTFRSLAFARRCRSRMPITACDLLYERVLPFYVALDVPGNLDEFMHNHNAARSHRGYRLSGQTPPAALRAALKLEALSGLDFTRTAPPSDRKEQSAAELNVNA
jgi:hypothetical protein